MSIRKGTKFGKRIYVKWNEISGISTDAPWREVFDDPADAGEIGEVVEVGVYELVGKSTVRMQPEVITIKK